MNIPTLPLAQTRHAGGLVYIHGTGAATITVPGKRGAYVRDHSDLVEAYYEWDRLTDEPAPPLRFSITRDPWQHGYWYVHGNRPDWSGDYNWAVFPSQQQAVAWTCLLLAHPEAIISYKEGR
jgi:hypothetical protein